MKRNILFLMLLLPACYEYAPFDPSETSLGKAVRVQLTSVGTQHVAPFVGPNAEYLDGNLSSITDSTYTLAIADLGRSNSSEESWHGEPITVKRGDVESIELRKASLSRSAGLTAFVLGAAVLVGRAVGGISATGVTKPNGTGTGQ